MLGLGAILTSYINNILAAVFALASISATGWTSIVNLFTPF